MDKTDALGQLGFHASWCNATVNYWLTATKLFRRAFKAKSQLARDFIYAKNAP